MRAAIEQKEVVFLNCRDPSWTLHGTAEALAIFDVEVEDHQTPLRTNARPQHTDAIRLLRGGGVGLLSSREPGAS